MRDLLKVVESDEKKFLRVPYIITGLELAKKTRNVTDGKDASGLIEDLGAGQAQKRFLK